MNDQAARQLSVNATRAAFVATTVGLAAFFVGGCSELPPQNPVTTSESHPTAVADGTNASKTLAADEAVRRVFQGLQTRQARAVWDFLPPSYRADIQQLVREVSSRLDERSWAKAVAVLRKARRVLSDKREVWSNVGTKPNSGVSSESQLAVLVRLLNVLGKSELTDWQRLQEIDVGRFVEVTGHEILDALAPPVSEHSQASDPFANFSKVEVTLVSADDELAVVRLRWPGQQPTDYDYVLVEQQWLPKSLADGWQTQIDELRTQCLAWADDSREHPERWETRLNELDRWLDEFAQAKSTTEIQTVWQRGWSQISAVWLGVPLKSAAQNNSENPPTKPTATNKTKTKIPDTEELLPDESPRKDDPPRK